MAAHLLSNLFQIGYVTRSLDEATALFGRDFGVGRWDFVTPPDTSAIRQRASCYCGDVVVELIEPRVDRPSFYQDWLADDAVVRMHHWAFMARDIEEWDAWKGQYRDQGIAIVAEENLGDALRFFYADTIGVTGHYSKVVMLGSGGETYLARKPRN